MISVMCSERSDQFTESQVFQAAVDFLVDYFSDARATGIEIHESQARIIADGIIQHLHCNFDSRRPK